ncbi:MAG: hypothetical protein JNK30_07065 [Phenylobacterium sp.]|uniref:LuxR C-terminal-related transcriptional regulator n=1 Tax=Phenylobacterium sp. TaxID=1871053 RepID=UPI001A370A4C|nr:LuxR C-terminal-related transcriptional regulator [Phenylobacterium sp.]MBL8771129.1 hypothetical protein [Phenylobacterium sp.]
MSNRGRPRHGDVLTPAEWRVVEAVRHGLTNGQIATRRRISLDAVKFHVANAILKLGLDDRAALRAWAGVRRDSNLGRRVSQMDAQPVLGPVGQISRSVRRVAEAEAWYRDVVGLPHLFTHGPLAFFDCGGVRLFLEEGPVKAESVIYFRVPDIRAAHAELERRGARFVSAPHLIHTHEDGTEEWMAFFHDPEERPLAIMSQVAAG